MKKILAVLLFAIALVACAFTPSKPISKVETTPSLVMSSQAPIMDGIDASAFDKAVKDKIAKIDETKIIGKVETRLSTAGNDKAYVNLYLSNNDSWSDSSSADQKDFIKTMGDLVRAIADLNKYDNSQTIYTNTTILSSAGNELAVDDFLGNITIK